MKLTQNADLRVADHGTVVLLYAETERGTDWVERNVQENDGIGWHLADRVVEHRYVNDIVTGAGADGLVVRGW